MIRTIVLSTAMSIGVGLIAVALLRWLYLIQIRHFNNQVADDLLNDWELQLTLLDPAEREQRRLAPPANIVAAMALKTPRGLSGLGGGAGEPARRL